MSNKHPSQSEIARALGITPGRVTQLKKKGMPNYSIEAARAWKAQHIAPVTGSKADLAPAAPLGGNALVYMPAAVNEHPQSYESSRARREAADADMAELKIQELRGDMVRLSAVKAVWANTISNTRNALLQLPSRIAPVVAAESDINACSCILESAIYEALTQMATGHSMGVQSD
jgi:transcriptional regulator with XRE-family HTH domain